MTTVIMVDIVKIVWPTAPPAFMKKFSKVSSLIIMVVTVSIALYGSPDLVQLINMTGAYQNLLIFMFLPVL